MSEGPYSIGGDPWPGLSKLIEECGEVAQVAGKIIGAGGATNHWDGSNLRERLTEEIADVIAACSFVAQHNELDLRAIDERVAEKRRRFEAWHAASPCRCTPPYGNHMPDCPRRGRGTP